MGDKFDRRPVCRVQSPAFQKLLDEAMAGQQGGTSCVRIRAEGVSDHASALRTPNNTRIGFARSRHGLERGYGGLDAICVVHRQRTSHVVKTARLVESVQAFGWARRAL
jgi:hypothetical protein